jgi:hypothetical protein
MRTTRLNFFGKLENSPATIRERLEFFESQNVRLNIELELTHAENRDLKAVVAKYKSDFALVSDILIAERQRPRITVSKNISDRQLIIQLVECAD